MSESLKQKAKTLPEWHVEVRKKGETDCGCCSSIGTKDACCDCAVILSWHPKFIEVSVAQQELGQIETRLAEEVMKYKLDLERERGLLKQKLGEYVEKLKEEEKIIETGNYGFDNPLTSVIHAKLDTCKVVREKLEELLSNGS